MRCEELRNLLDVYMDGELPEEAAQRVERHLLRCQSCAYEVRALEQTREMLRQAVPQAETTPQFRERTATRLLNALSPSLRSVSAASPGRQWTLPFRDEQAS